MPIISPLMYFKFLISNQNIASFCADLNFWIEDKDVFFVSVYIFYLGVENVFKTIHSHVCSGVQ